MTLPAQLAMFCLYWVVGAFGHLSGIAVCQPSIFNISIRYYRNHVVYTSLHTTKLCCWLAANLSQSTCCLT